MLLILSLLISITNAASTISTELSNYDFFLSKIESEKLAVHQSQTDNKCELSYSLEEVLQNDALKPPDVKKLSNKTRLKLIQDAPQILKRFWMIRLKYNKDFQLLNQSLKLSEDCVQKMHEYLMYLRQSEELLMLFFIKHNVVDKNTQTFFTSPEPFSWSTTPHPFQIKAGDLILSRGVSFSSTYVAQMVSPARSFSHISFVAQDAGNLVIIDLFPSGAWIVKLEDWLKEDETRLAVYRHRDSKLAEKAAQEALQLVKDYQKNNNKNFPYHYNSNSNSSEPDSSLFCTGLVSWGFYKASNGKGAIPKYGSFFYFLENSDVLKNLGVRNPHFFHPSDIETDPRFYLAAESRQTKNILESLRRDAIFLLLSEQLSQGKYQYKYNWITTFKTYFTKIKAFCCDNSYISYVNNIPTSALTSLVEINDKVENLDKKISSQPETMTVRQYLQVLR